MLPAAPYEVNRWFVDEVRPHEPALRAYLRARYPDLTDPDDVVQETFVRVLRVKQGGEVRSARSLLFVTARNVAVDAFRRKLATPVAALANLEALAVVEEKAGAGDASGRERELALLDEAIRALPARCREIIMLKKIHGLSYEEIARRLGISRHTISAQITIGVTKCRDYLAARGVRRPSGEGA
jgi:RNA polymerase sigma-70 factor (ECF subfamily)